MLKHGPPGSTHRNVDQEQIGIGIVVPRKGSLVTTEARTRQLTDHWQSNLLMQKKPNVDGIQCHDPRLNKHVVAQKAPEYNKHINISGEVKPLALMERSKQRMTSHSNRPGDTLDEFQTSADTPRLMRMDSNRTTDTLTPPPHAPQPPTHNYVDSTYMNVSGTDDDLFGNSAQAQGQGWGRGRGHGEAAESSFELTGLPLSRPTSQGLGHKQSQSAAKGNNNNEMRVIQRPLTMDRGSPSLQPHEHSLIGAVHMPHPMSPSALAQKLRRYRIGSSPQQKVRNLLDDLQENQKALADKKRQQTYHATHFGKQGMGVDGRGHSIVRMATAGADGGLLATNNPNPDSSSPDGHISPSNGKQEADGRGLRGDDSFWDETSEGADARHQIAYLGKDQLTNYLLSLPPETLGSFVGEDGRGLNLGTAGLEMDSKAIAQLSQADYIFLVKQIQRSAPATDVQNFLLEQNADGNADGNGNGNGNSNFLGDEDTGGAHVEVVGVQMHKKSSANRGAGAELASSVLTDTYSKATFVNQNRRSNHHDYQNAGQNTDTDEESLHTTQSFLDDNKNLNALIKRSALFPASIGLDANRSYSRGNKVDGGNSGYSSIREEFQHFVEARGRGQKKNDQYMQNSQDDGTYDESNGSSFDDIDGDSIPSLQSYTTAQHNQYLRDYEHSRKRGSRTKPPDGQVYDPVAVKRQAEEVHRNQQLWKLYKEDTNTSRPMSPHENVFQLGLRGGSSPAVGRVSTGRTLGDRTNTGYQKPGAYNYQHGEESSRGAFSEMPLPTVVHPSHPPCHLCKRDGRLWCDHCRVIYCYKCWGTIDHHEAKDATAALHADVLLMKRTLKMEREIIQKSMRIADVPPISKARNDSVNTAQHLENSLAQSIAGGQEQVQGQGHAGHWSADQFGSNVNISLPVASYMEQSLSMSLSPGSSLEMANSPSVVLANNNDNGENDRKPLTDRMDNMGEEFDSFERGSLMENPDPQTVLAEFGDEYGSEYGLNLQQGKEHGGDDCPTHHHIAQFSRTHAEAHYFRQVKTPFVPPGSAVQTRMIDAYVEYDEIHVIHFSPAKKDSTAAKALAQRNAHMMAVTSERMKGYATQDQEQKMRQTRAAQGTAQKIARAVQLNYPNRFREQGKRQIMRLEAARVDGRPEPKVVDGLGKLVLEDRGYNPADFLNSGDNGTGFSVTGVGLYSGQTIEQVKATNAVLHFENSPLNRTLQIPPVNADGTEIRQPCDIRLIDQQEKRERAEKKMQQALIHSEKVEQIEQEKENQMRLYKLALVAKKQALEIEKQFALSMRGKYSPPHGARPRISSPTVAGMPAVQGQGPEEGQRQEEGEGHMPKESFEHVSVNAHKPISLELERDPDWNPDGSVKLRRDEWGTHKMAAKSAQTGNFPQLPFRGPPYTVDLVTEEHFSTVVRPFSPERTGSPSRSPLVIDPRTVEERSLEIRAGDTSVSTIIKTHVLTSPIRSNRSVAANKVSQIEAEYNNSKINDALSHLSHSVSLQSGIGKGAGSGFGDGNGSIRKSKSGAGISITRKGSAGGSVSLTTAGKVSLWGTFKKTIGSTYDEDGTI